VTRSGPASRRLVSLVVLSCVLVTAAAGVAHGHTDAGATPTSTATTTATLDGGVAFGAFVEGMQQDPGTLADFEQLVGAGSAIASYYYGFGDVFPGPTELAFADGGRRDVLLSWDMGATRFRGWASGRYDGYLDRIASAARSYPYPVYVRPWPEMNGDWQAFQPTASGDRPRGGTYAQFVSAWRHVVRYTREAGATNLRWVFDPAADTYAGTTPVKAIWPGVAYVDVLGIDGFNWGADAGWGRWRSFDAIFAPMYRILTRLDAAAPVWICEFGSKEPRVDDGAPVDPAHSKAAWLRQALDRATMPRVRALVYFQASTERDWRVNSSDEVLQVLRAALAGQ
jgi:mannan endo-1,4-beta-mannosidase